MATLKIWGLGRMHSGSGRIWFEPSFFGSFKPGIARFNLPLDQIEGCTLVQQQHGWQTLVVNLAGTQQPAGIAGLDYAAAIKMQMFIQAQIREHRDGAGVSYEQARAAALHVTPEDVGVGSNVPAEAPFGAIYETDGGDGETSLSFVALANGRTTVLHSNGNRFDVTDPSVIASATNFITATTEITGSWTPGEPLPGIGDLHSRIIKLTRNGIFYADSPTLAMAKDDHPFHEALHAAEQMANDVAATLA